MATWFKELPTTWKSLLAIGAVAGCVFVFAGMVQEYAALPDEIARIEDKHDLEQAESAATINKILTGIQEIKRVLCKNGHAQAGTPDGECSATDPPIF